MNPSDASRRTPKLRSVTGTVSPDSTLLRYLYGGGGSPIPIKSSFGYRTEFSSSSGSGGTSRRSLTPMSDIANLISPGTPVKLVDEDVLVMDGILMSGARVSKSSDSSGSFSSSGSSGGIRRNMMEMCRFWEEMGECRAGYKCKFAHGKEELRPSFIAMRNKSEFGHGKEELRQSFNSMKINSETHSPNSYPPKPRFLSTPSPTAMPFRPEIELKSQNQSQNSALNLNKNTARMCLSKSPTFIKPEMSKKSPITNTKSRDWLPSDDGIKVRLPECSIDQDVESCIHNFLHGPSNRKRLPVFTEFCPR
ncbi:hypothetical protein M5689_008087 [Euphorbia peplus]|nr:hypothetical protein M5689_008087 [Euphorbia peplus]